MRRVDHESTDTASLLFAAIQDWAHPGAAPGWKPAGARHSCRLGVRKPANPSLHLAAVEARSDLKVALRGRCPGAPFKNCLLVRRVMRGVSRDLVA